jgi:hypothetical protein
VGATATKKSLTWRTVFAWYRESRSSDGVALFPSEFWRCVSQENKCILRQYANSFPSVLKTFDNKGLHHENYCAR